MRHVLNCSGHELKIPYVVKSQGVYLTDEQGKRYADLESGVWCLTLGHNHPHINQAICQQIEQITHTGFCYASHIVNQAAEAILSITEIEDGKCVFLSSGSEAIEILRQMSRHMSTKQHTLTLHDAYLGSYSSTLERDENSWYSFDWSLCQTCPKSEECDSGCSLLQAIPSTIREFIFEPGSASGFVRFPPKAMITNLVNTVKQQGGVVIVNEVTTGIGKTGKWFGYQHYDLQPDMIAIGKGIGNGYPVSVAVVKQDIANELAEKSFVYYQSHQNDPLGAAVALEVLRVIQQERLIEEAERKGYLFHHMLQSLVDGNIIPGIRGKGLMFAIEIANCKLVDEIYDELIKKGFIVCNRKTFLRLDLPLNIEEQIFEEFITTFQTIIASKTL